MKAIMISIRSEWVVKILNGEKTIEIRKTMPKCELPVEVYVYCTKGKPFIGSHSENGKRIFTNHLFGYVPYYNGKVVAKFTLNKVEEFEERMMLYEQNSIYKGDEYIGELQSTNLDGLLEKSCLTNEELEKYIGIEESKFYAWNIDNLQVFDKPKKLSEFRLMKCNYGLCSHCKYGNYFATKCAKLPVPLTKAPQSWCYVEKK